MTALDYTEFPAEAGLSLTSWEHPRRNSHQEHQERMGSSD